MGIQGLNLFWPNHGYKHISSPTFGADSHSTTKPPAQVMKEIQDIFYRFLWDGKPDKPKRNVIINNYEEGGLKLSHIEFFCKALKVYWL